MAELTSRERVRMSIGHQEPDRVPIHDEPWAATVARWRREGLPDDVTPAEIFGYEIGAVSADLSPRYPATVLEETKEFVITRTPEGGIRRNYLDYSTTPEIIDSPIKTKDDWPTIRERLQPDPSRVNWDGVRAAVQRYRDQGLYVIFGAAGGYDKLQSYLPSEELLMVMAEDPEWFKEMVDTLSSLTLETVKMLVREGITVDAVWFYNDMGYRNGPLFSPRMYEELIAPSDKERNDWFHEQGMQTILHSCGNVKSLIPGLINAGFDCLQPLEVKAGMDLRELKPIIGDDLALFGGIDVRLMQNGTDEEMEEEIRSKFEAAKPGGGYLYHSDHSVPLGVSWERYCFLMECVKKYGVY